MRLLAGRLELLCHRLSRELMIATFAAALLANAIAITNVFPYAPLMTEWQGMTDDRRELGFYAGFFMAAYQISQMLTSYHLGKLSDTHGRKRVILLGLATCTIPQVLFGLAMCSTVTMPHTVGSFFPSLRPIWASQKPSESRTYRYSYTC